MLVQLYIENVAVIQRASIQLTPGFNVFTGETGAGKTILISAIDAVLGERTSRDIIRTGEDRAVVSALFENLSDQVLERLGELGYTDDEGALLITREITAAGKTSCKINGMPATTSILREIATLLIHIHGQRDSQQLLLSEHHMELVDAFGELEGEVAAYHIQYSRMRTIREQLTGLHMDEAQKAQRMDMLTFQIEEIEAADLGDEDEEGQLLERRSVIRHSEKILEGLSSGYSALSGSEEAEGIRSQMDLLQEGLATAGQYVPQFGPAASRVEAMAYELEEISVEVHRFLEEFEFDPQEQLEIESRLDILYKLKQKYGHSIAEILAFCQGAQEELDTISTSEEQTKKLTAELADATAKAEKLAAALTKKRKKAAQQFMVLVESELSFLDMPSVKLSLSHQQKALSGSGADDMEFLIITNVGEVPKPLSKIASGGEIARIMLAIKNVLADRDQIATLIFDEVDTGVSGRAAQKIGQKLRQVSRSRQVICVTHLAQVAAFGDSHLLINKEVDGGRTFTRVKSLDQTGTIQELARLTSGDMITDLALQNAQQLWETSQKIPLDK